ncbi:hypothetical protein [Agromyces sp. NPDC058064]|uniref:hypothetical protein n=1 Tax=Agromyces sp. NPDC058064 TaxID=3346322 RepID=UPI0036DAD5B4
MQQVRVRFEGREYLLPRTDDPEVVMANITALVRAGGGFVETVHTATRRVSIFVSPGMTLSVEVVEVDDGDGDEDEVIGAAALESWLARPQTEQVDDFDELDEFGLG